MNKDTDLDNKLDKEVVADTNFPAYSAGRIMGQHVSGFFKKTGAWIREKLNAHYDRLIALRAYDQRRN